MKNVMVPTGEKRETGLSETNLSTLDLEACVALAGRNGNNGVMMHLTQISPLKASFDWFRARVPTSEKVYLVGGMDGKSEGFVSTLRTMARDAGYQNIVEDTLGRYQRNLSLSQTEANVEYVQRTRYLHQEGSFVASTKSLD